MGVNSLASPGYGFNDAATLLGLITTQATGRASLTATNLQDFISVGQTALSVGPDPLMQAISQVLSRTIFSVRPYSEKFQGLRATDAAWGNHVRKLSVADSDWESDQRYYEAASDFLDDGDTVDMYKIRMPGVLQTNFYGQNVVQRCVTIFRDQLTVAFSSPDELMRFVSMIMQNVSDQLAQGREASARMALANFIGGKNILGTGHVIHLIDEFNTETGASLDSTTIFLPGNYDAFTRWLAGFMRTLSDRMSERSQLYQVNVTGKPVMRHTPRQRQKLYISAEYYNRMATDVMSTTFNPDKIALGDFETVGYWQAIDSPTSVKVNPVYMNTSGALVNGAAQTVDNIFGLLFDEEAIMIQTVNEWSAPSPFNAAGGYTNTFWHQSVRYLNDFNEKGILLLLDEASP